MKKMKYIIALTVVWSVILMALGGFLFTVGLLIYGLFSIFTSEKFIQFLTTNNTELFTVIGSATFVFVFHLLFDWADKFLDNYNSNH